MIQIPTELIGQKITPFMEWFLDYNSKLEDSTIKNLLSHRIAKFFNQPFSTDMLVNPHKRWIKQDTTDIDSYAAKHYDLSDIENPEWIEAEKNKIFEGWEYRTCSITVLKLNSCIVIEKRKSDFRLWDGSRFWYFLTLKDFISLCQMVGVELGEWK